MNDEDFFADRKRNPLQDQTGIHLELMSQNATLQHWLSDVEQSLQVNKIGVLTLGRQLDLQNATPNFEKIIGVSSKDRGRPICQVLTAAGFQELARFIEDAFAKAPAVSTMTLRMAHQDWRVRFWPDLTQGDQASRYILTIVGIARAAEHGSDNLGANRTAVVEENRFHELLENVPFALGIHVGASHTCIFANQEFCTWHPGCDPIGTTLAERCGSHPNAESKRLLDTAFKTGEQQIGRKVPFTNVRAQGQTETRYFTGVAQPYRGRDGNVHGVMALTFEVTDEQRQLQQKELLILEMRHRLKNVLAVTQGLATFSAENASNKQEFLDKFQERISAIGRAANDIVSPYPGPLKIETLLRRELSRLDPEQANRVHASSEFANLPGSLTLPLTLIVHELTSNAIKYGAFSESDGALKVTCRTEGDDGSVVFRWQEFIGDAGARKARRETGFGSRLILEIVPKQIGASASLRFEPDGIVYELRLCGRDLKISHDQHSPRIPGVLVVDDECVYAASLELALRRAGYEVIGPYVDAETAIETINTLPETIRCAILDKHLGGGETCDRIVEELRKRSIPYILHTAEDSSTHKLPMDQETCTVLMKPAPLSRILSTVRQALTAAR